MMSNVFFLVSGYHLVSFMVSAPLRVELRSWPWVLDLGRNSLWKLVGLSPSWRGTLAADWGLGPEYPDPMVSLSLQQVSGARGVAARTGTMSFHPWLSPQHRVAGTQVILSVGGWGGCE